MKIRKLPCGARMVMEQIPYVQSCAIGIWVGAGAVDEEKKYSGISHFTEHMSFKGTEKRNTKEIAYEIDSIGGQMNAFTGMESTCYYVKSTKENFKKSADVLMDIVMNSIYGKEEMDRERMVVGEEIKRYMDTPDDLAIEAASDIVFKDSSLGNSVLGNFASIKRVNTAVMKKYVEENYTAQRIVISVAGNFDEKAAYNFFAKYFSVPMGKKRKTQKLTPYKPGYKTIVKDIEQAHLCLATRGVALGDDNYYAISVAANALGGSMSSRLFQNIREQRGLAYSVFSSNICYSKSGYFVIYAGVAKDKVAAAIDGIREELTKLRNDGFTEEEFNSSREQLKASYVFSQENVSSRMMANGKNLLLLDKIYTPSEIINGFNKLTLDDVNKTLKIISKMEKYSGALVSPNKVNIGRLI